MRPTEIAARRARIRLPKKRLAELASLDEMTVGRALRPGANPLNNTMAALERALLAEELELLKQLAELHPQYVLKHADRILVA